MKRRIGILLIIALLLSTFICANAADIASSVTLVSTKVIQYPDGSYCVETIYREEAEATRGSTQTTSGSKNHTLYNAAGVRSVTLTVHGSFEYNQITATATSASYTHQIHQSGWSLSSGSAEYSGATATATGTFKKFLTPSVTATVSLTCSPTGVLS